MKMQIEVKILPFRIPDFVEVDDEENRFGVDQIRLSELSIENLHLLCDDFKRNVFQKAGKPLVLKRQ